MSKKITRRQFLKLLAATTAGSSILLYKLANIKTLKSMAQSLANKTYLPVVMADTPEPTSEPPATPPPPTATETGPAPTETNAPNPPPTGARVVHVHDTDATNWNGSQTDYWNYVNQNVVDNMVDQGIMTLTNTTTAADAWRVLLPGYKSGETIAIKVSFNNSFDCGENSPDIDGLSEPVNAIVRGLKQIGVLEANILIFDAIRALPSRFVNGCLNLYSSLQFFDNGCHQEATWKSDDPYKFIVFSPPNGIPIPPPVLLTDVLINADYLINMPIMKKHGGTEISLSFKNHFGSIINPGDLHDYVYTNRVYYTPDYNPLVDIYLNPHIREKTILTIGDALFSAKRHSLPPSLWTTFADDVPNSLFISVDPVAVDCVMCDFVAAEMEILDGSDSYLSLAMNAGLGVYERGNPWVNSYKNIEYIKTVL